MPPWGTTRLASSILTGDAGAPPAAFPLFPISPLCPISPICPICPITPLNIKGTSRRDQPPRYGWRSTRYMYSHTPYGSDGFCLRMDKYPPLKDYSQGVSSPREVHPYEQAYLSERFIPQESFSLLSERFLFLSKGFILSLLCNILFKNGAKLRHFHHPHKYRTTFFSSPHGTPPHHLRFSNLRCTILRCTIY